MRRYKSIWKRKKKPSPATRPYLHAASKKPVLLLSSPTRRKTSKLNVEQKEETLVVKETNRLFWLGQELGLQQSFLLSFFIVLPGSWIFLLKTYYNWAISQSRTEGSGAHRSYHGSQRWPSGWWRSFGWEWFLVDWRRFFKRKLYSCNSALQTWRSLDDSIVWSISKLNWTRNDGEDEWNQSDWNLRGKVWDDWWSVSSTVCE